MNESEKKVSPTMPFMHTELKTRSLAVLLCMLS
jgi:hypothetical protein